LRVYDLTLYSRFKMISSMAAASAAFNIDDASAPAPAAADSRAAAIAEFCSHPSLISLALAAPPAASSSPALHESEDTYPPSNGDENVAAEAVVPPKPKLSERDSFIQKLNRLPPIPDATSEESCKAWVAEIKRDYPDFNDYKSPPPYIPDPKVWFDGWGDLSPKDGSYKQRWTLLHEAFKIPPLSIIDRLPAITYEGSHSVTPVNGRKGVSFEFIFWYPKSIFTPNVKNTSQGLGCDS